MNMITPGEGSGDEEVVGTGGSEKAVDSNGSKQGDVDVTPWQVMIVDDDKIVHTLTHMILSDFTFAGRPVQLIFGESGAQAKQLLEQYPDVAVIILDVVMEEDDSGLDVVQHIRKVMGNPYIRIILRTGQPGHAPESSVVSDYEINDYRDKSELTAQKLLTSLATSLRSYQELTTMAEKLKASNV